MYKIISFDAESNGLHGEIFAIGAVCVGGDTPPEIFEGRCATPEPTDQWVVEHVLPFIEQLPIYPSARYLRDAFWDWLQLYKVGAIIIADFGVPVEANLLAACQRDDPVSRAWRHPYPLHELGTFLLAAGVDPDISRSQFANLPPTVTGFQHNPYFDALTAAYCWKRAAEMIDYRNHVMSAALELLDKAGVWTGADDDLLDRLSFLIDEYKTLRGQIRG